MSEFFVVYIKTLHNGAFQFYQNLLIQKVLDDIDVEHCNRFTTLTKVEAPIGAYDNCSKAKRYFPRSYASFIGMVLYMA